MGGCVGGLNEMFATHRLVGGCVQGEKSGWAGGWETYSPVLPEASKRDMSTVLVLLARSTNVSVPTSRRPTFSRGISYLFKRFSTTVKAMELMSSRSPTKAIPAWPSPDVNFPWLTYRFGGWVGAVGVGGWVG